MALWALNIHVRTPYNSPIQKKETPVVQFSPLKGGLDPNKISGVGTFLWLVVHVLLGPTKQRALKQSVILS
jgi:hypothetical protein